MFDFGDGGIPFASPPDAEPPTPEATAGPAPRPRYKHIDRDQAEFRPFALDTLIEEDHPARAIWELLGDIDLSAFEQHIKAVEGRPGQTTLQPRLLIALWLFACAAGVHSARELSRLCKDAPAYRWLCGDEPVNYHTLADFRVEQDEALRRLFIEVLAVLSCAGLIELQRVTHDGTRIRSVAGNDSFRGEKNLQKHLQEAARQVEAMANANEAEASTREKAARERAARERKQRLEQAQEQLQQIQAKKSAEDKEKARASLTEPEARIMRQAREGGYAPGYNAQISMDTKAGVIINLDVTQESSDAQQLVPALESIKETFGFLPAQTLVDSGYTNRSNIVELDGRTDMIGPLDQQEQTAQAQQKRNGVGEEFRTEKFHHDAATNTLRCPAGQILRFVQDRQRPGKVDHIFQAQAGTCTVCAYKAQCCPHTASRTVMRIEECEAVTRFRAKMDTPEAKRIYKERSQGEFPNCWIKEKLGLRRFHVRGLAKVKLEALWHVITYNVQLWIRKCWLVQGKAVAA